MLAHQGGWDEALLVVVPIVALGALVFYSYVRQTPDPERDDNVAETSEADGS